MSTSSEALARIGGASITPEVANHVLWAYSYGGYSGGSFTAALISLISAADEENKGRLAKGFFGYVMAVQVIEVDADGAGILRRAASAR